MSYQNLLRPHFLRLAAILMLLSATAAAQGVATLRGQITDQLGGAVAGASVTLIDEEGGEQITKTDEIGMYRFRGLRQGTYSLRAAQRGFAAYARTGIFLVDGQMGVVDLRLTVALQNQSISIAADESLSTDPNANKNELSIKGQDLGALPDDPDDLVSVLYALAGPAGPNGADLFMDGFTVTTPILPDKQTIREIVINRNPFSAEYDRIGLARIEIATKPGSGRFHGGADFNFSDSVLNARNPYADIRPPYRKEIYTGNLSGPLSPKKASFFFSFNRRVIGESALIDATILDESLNVKTLRQVVSTPESFLILNPRFDLQLNEKNTLSARDAYTSSALPKNGVGDVSLSSTAFDLSTAAHQMQLTETSILTPKVVNETRFQFSRWRRSQTEATSTPRVQVLDAFIGGGSDVGRNNHVQMQSELHNYTTVTSGPHTLRFGGRLRAAWISDVNERNLDGTYIFSGRAIPELDGKNQIVLGPDGQPRLIEGTSIEVYRRTILFQRLGLSPQQVRALGGGATQFLQTTGTPFARLRQVDFGGFVQDDWKLRPDFTLSMGLRYQNQTNAQGNHNFAPRAAFAWAPWVRGTDQPMTVIRAGAGIFYDLVHTPLSLQAIHLNGLRQRQFIVTDTQALDSFPNVPSISALGSLPQTTVHVAPDLREPYSFQTSVSIEQSLPHKITLTATYLHARGLHLLRERNINAPLPDSGIRPFGNPNNIYEYESNGIYKQNLFIVSGTLRPSPRLTLSASYALGYLNSDTDDPGTFPASSYDLRGEYGRAAIDQRHRFILSGTINLLWGLSLNPYLQAQTQGPFNITTGSDNNNDSQFFDRPAFATDLRKPSVISTPFGNFDIAPGPGQKIIPRNFGDDPGYFSLNLRLNKTFVLGGEGKVSANGQQTKQALRRPYKLTVGLSASNIFNRTNRGGLVGDLSSPMFGQSIAIFQIGQSSPSSNRSMNINLSLSF